MSGLLDAISTHPWAAILVAITVLLALEEVCLVVGKFAGHNDPPDEDH